MKKITPMRLCLLLLLAILPMTLIHAQGGTSKTPKKVTTDPKPPILPPAKAPVAKNMKEFVKTPQGAKRNQALAKTFGTNGQAAKDIKYPDGTSLHLKMVKNPSFADQPTSITAKIKSDKEKKPEVSNDASGKTWNCTTDHVQLEATSTTFLNNDYSAQASHIYPGACYTFDDFYNGSYKETQGERNAIVIMTDNPNVKGTPYRTIANPNMATIRAGLDDLFREATKTTANESLTYQMYETSNSADQSIKISGGASGYGISVSGSYGTGSQSSTINLTIDAIKTLFSINTIPPDSGFFKDAKTEATPNLMVMGSVSYGVRVLANLTATFSSQQEAADFSASYSGFGVSANVALDQLSKSKSVSSTINCYVVGGPGNSTVSFDKKDLQKQIESIMAGASYKNAMPVKYEFYSMGGDVVGSNSATDNFAVRQCTPGKDDPRLESVYVTFQTGGDNKNQDDDYIMYLYPGSFNQTVNPSTSNLDQWLNYIASGSVYGYGTGPNSPEYPNNSSTTVQMWKQNREATLDEFTGKGGALRIHLEPNNTDTWDISAITATLNFAGSVTPPEKITFSRITPLSNNNTDLVLYFGPDFKQR